MGPSQALLVKLLTCAVQFLCFAPIGAACAISWADFSFGWKLNWRLLVDLMVHKEFDTQHNNATSPGLGSPGAANGTKGLSLLDLMLRLNGVQRDSEE